MLQIFSKLNLFQIDRRQNKTHKSTGIRKISFIMKHEHKLYCRHYDIIQLLEGVNFMSFMITALINVQSGLD